MAETKPAQVPASPATAAVGGMKDRVVMASRRSDGTPNQSADFEYIGDKETVLEATKEQLRQQAVSAVDAAERSDIRGPQDEDSSPDAAVQALKDKHEAAEKAAEKAAEAEVNARFTEK